ncbi:zinc ribbon domain-containing protein [Streptomyces sp. NBC_00234]|uniref:Zn-ribbon domain-containing OB-fold protein n=1 Tax=Streptomyces sp. NBC_00234 TaxID=2903638 RepID=UPI002E2CF4E5|nr:zinc ribbon domain-containing protein [Streptomyces sp. NBC_00234]
MSHTRTPVVAGWFTEDCTEEDFRLLGTRCSGCSTVSFPREDGFCRNPGCPGGEPAEVQLSKQGTVWSFTDGRYRPPPPYVSDPDVPWEPCTLVAVELAAERIVVLGQAAPGVGIADLTIGMTVEAVPGVLADAVGSEDLRATWNWRPVPTPDSGAPDGGAA